MGTLSIVGRKQQIKFDEEGKIKGLKVERWRSSSRLDSAEITLTINRFRNFSSNELGIYLPEPKELALLQDLENEISKHSNQEYL